MTTQTFDSELFAVHVESVGLYNALRIEAGMISFWDIEDEEIEAEAGNIYRFSEEEE